MEALADSTAKRSVQSYWQAGPCGAKHARSASGSPAFYAEVEQRRYELEPFIARHARFAEAAGQSVLEIGTGLGTDAVAFARAGARVTGVDLTERSVQLVRRRFALEGRTGDFRIADAEALPFPDAHFDVVYSWGVIHHTPNTRAAAAEAVRVLRPGGRLCVMVYARHSWVALGLWARHALLAARPRRTLAEVIAAHMESDGTTAYTRREACDLFAGLANLRVTQVATPYDRRVGGPLVRLSGGRLGWFLVVAGEKPAAGRES